jgi:hypothetical protein
VLAIIPVTVIKNGIRIVSLTLLSIHVDPGYLTGQLHREGGIAFFLLALGLLGLVLAALRAAEAQITKCRCTCRVQGAECCAVHVRSA